MNVSTLVQKLWNYCNVLRDNGMSYGDYAEQLTFLVFLKTADERLRPPHNQSNLVPAEYACPFCPGKSGAQTSSSSDESPASTVAHSGTSRMRAVNGPGY